MTFSILLTTIVFVINFTDSREEQVVLRATAACFSPHSEVGAAARDGGSVVQLWVCPWPAGHGQGRPRPDAASLGPRRCRH